MRVPGMKRAIDLRGAVSINVITMIGIGPLVTIPLVLAALGGPLALVGWIAGAIVALCDGLVWAELSSHYPGSGGTYVYLRNVFGPQGLGRALAFLFNWQFLLYAPCLLASGYIGFANYAAYLWPQLSSPIAHDALAVGIGVLTILLLYRRTSAVASLGAALAIAATLTVALVAVAGLTHADFGRAFTLTQPVRLNLGFLAGFGSALFVTLYDYVGYADAALLGDEVVAAHRTIPRSILISVLLVAVLYVALQIGVLGAIPWQSLLDAHGQPTVQSQYVGALVVEHVWGRAAAIGVTILVLVTAFASLYGNLLGFSRISFAAARDGAFLAAFSKLHPRKDIPHVALFTVGALSLIASFFTLDQVIAFLTAGIVLIQGIAQIIALAILRRRDAPAPFRMPLYPLPAIVALAGWALAFVSTGSVAIALGVGWLLAGSVVFAVAAYRRRWWPFAALAIVALMLPTRAIAATQPLGWSTWNTSAVRTERGYPEFTVDGRPFFVYGAAFFYERIPRDRWPDTLRAYRALGVNTIDLYCIWNWHATDPGSFDFTGATDPRRDLLGLLKLTHQFGLKVILRPGPVIRNEWRNGGYPAWLLERPEYRMPLHDVLEGRYPATATLQNAHADAAAAEWLANGTHLSAAREWLRNVLRAVEPYSHDVIAIALDDDQGAYIDNDTWPAPHWHAYMDWLRATVAAVVGNRVPLFVNTYEMKVPSASPAWAWGNWYQSDAYSIGAHDLADLDFATGLLQTQPQFPVMASEFQAGWLQGADEGAPRPSDPSNTALALAELLREGAHGIVNFPLQDTIDPHGWEAPWANWSYAWDAALTVNLRASPRYLPARIFGDAIRRYGTLLARTHVAADASIVWTPRLFEPQSVSNADFLALANLTTALLRACNARGISCTLVDLGAAGNGALRTRSVILPVLPSGPVTQRLLPWAAARLEALRRAGRLVADPAAVAVPARHRRDPNTTLLLADDGSYAFVVAVNPGDTSQRVHPMIVRLAHRSVRVGAFWMRPRTTRIVPVGVSAPAPRAAPFPRFATPPPFSDPSGTTIANSHLRMVFAPFAGARVAELGDGGVNFASSIGLLRDATDPEPQPSARDYIAPYTHPLPAGTFNRAYSCERNDAFGLQRVACTYDAPDLPEHGAVFSRTITLAGSAGEIVVDEQFAPHDPHSHAQFESISGFAFASNDQLVRSSDGVGVLHAGHFGWLRWRPGDVAHVDLRATRGAEIVSLVFTRRAVMLHLGAQPARNAAEARRLLEANQR